MTITQRFIAGKTEDLRRESVKRTADARHRAVIQPSASRTTFHSILDPSSELLGCCRASEMRTEHRKPHDLYKRSRALHSKGNAPARVSLSRSPWHSISPASRKRSRSSSCCTRRSVPKFRPYSSGSNPLHHPLTPRNTASACARRLRSVASSPRWACGPAQSSPYSRPGRVHWPSAGDSHRKSGRNSRNRSKARRSSTSYCAATRVPGQTQIRYFVVFVTGSDGPVKHRSTTSRGKVLVRLRLQAVTDRDPRAAPW